MRTRTFGGLAQLARASGSYPAGRWFKSDIRYQMSKPSSASTYFFGPLVKRLRHGPFTAVTWVRFPYGSPDHKKAPQTWCFFFSCGLVTRTRNLTRRIAQSAYALGSQHCSAVSCGDLVKRSKFPGELLHHKRGAFSFLLG